MRDSIDLQILKKKDIAHGTSAPAQHRVDPGNQFRDREGLEDDVIRASIQPGDALLDGGRSGEKNERDVGPALLKRGDELQSRDPRKTQVKENQIEQGIVGKLGEGISRGNQLNGKVILLENVLEKLSQRRISLGYK
jgi:hypothetical protein